jgi:hypothetical protein
MPFIPVEDTVQVTVHATAPSGEIAENVFGWRLEDELDQTIADTISAYVADAYSNWTAVCSQDYSWDSVTVTDVRTIDGPSFESTDGWPLVGGVNSHALPLQTAALVTWLTPKRGKSFRGRSYMAGGCEEHSNGAHLDSASHTALAAFADAMFDLPGLTVISRYHSDGLEPPQTIPRDPGISTLVTGRVAHDLWATQRRRAPR